MPMNWMRKRKKTRTRRAQRPLETWGHLEPLEPRQLMAATLITPLNDLYVGTSSPTTTLTLQGSHFDDPQITGTAVEFNSNLGTFYADLFSTTKATTVNNFLNYITQGKYEDSIIHRSVSNFVVQGGGFVEPEGDPFQINAVVTNAAIVNQPGISNLRGTIAMAKLGGNPNSATSQWFFNLGDNSANLDNQNGGFTVFGQVIGDGMEVVDAIAAIPAFDKSGSAPDDLNNSAFTDIPLRNYTDGNPVARENLVLFDTIERVAELTFSIVSNSNAALVTPTINEAGQLVLTYIAGATGSSTITLRATDLFGAVVEDTFTVTRFTPQKGQTVTDENGKELKVSLKGPGRIEIAQSPDMKIAQLTLTQTNRTSNLLLKPEKNATVEVGNINVTGDLASLLGGDVNLGGDIRVTGVLGRLTFGDVADDHDIVVSGLGRQVPDITYITLGRVAETTLNVATPIVSLSVIDWQDDNTTADVVTAPWIRNLTTRGDKANNIPGDFEAGLNLTGAELPADQVPQLLIKAKINGDLRNANWTVPRGINSIQVTGAITDCILRATQSIASLSTARLVNSTVFAGVSAVVTTLPDETSDFSNALAAIERLTVAGVKGSAEPAWVKSQVAAGRLGAVKLGMVKTDEEPGPDAAHGLATRNLSKVQYIDADGILRRITPANLTDNEFTDDDFLIRLVVAPPPPPAP